MQLCHARGEGKCEKCGLHAFEGPLQIIVVIDIAY
jgi:hypothetical protein